MYLRGVRYTFSLCDNVSDDCRISDLTLGNVFISRLSARFENSNSTMKCFVEDTPNSYDGKAEFSLAITPVFSVTRSFKT